MLDRFDAAVGVLGLEPEMIGYQVIHNRQRGPPRAAYGSTRT